MSTVRYRISRRLSCCLVFALAAAAESGEAERRVEKVRRTPGFVALWDFVARREGSFDAVQPRGARHDFRLEPRNIVREFWGEGREATMEDFPLLGRGPFGNAIRIAASPDPSFRPTLLVPRERLHDTRLDIKGPRRSVTLLVWMIRESGNHALAGIWHEGTDLRQIAGATKRVEPGARQFALFAGLAANPGAVASHVSENGAQSFGDIYARNLSVTPTRMSERREAADPWDVAALVFDNQRDTVSSYLNGVAEEFWIEENLDRHPFFQWPAKAWRAGETQDASLPPAQWYRPPEGKAKRKQVLERSANGRVELHEFAFTKLRVHYDAQGRVSKRELVALKVNPFWFAHDLFTPPAVERGGPFTIGRVIKSSRHDGTSGWIGGVAVFDRALSAKQLRRLSELARRSVTRP